MDTLLFNKSFMTPGAFQIIPCGISSEAGISGAAFGENDLKPTPFEPDSKGFQRVLDTLAEQGRKLAHAVEEYPTAW